MYAGDGRFARGNGEQGSWEVEEREGKIILRLEWDRYATEELQVRGKAVQHTATHFNTLQHAARPLCHCGAICANKQGAKHYNALQDRCAIEELQCSSGPHKSALL